MIVIKAEPGKFPQVLDVENTLRSLQAQVGGHIETVTFAEDACFICNEEGRLNDMPFNMNLLGVPFVGTVLAVGIQGEEFTGLTQDQIGVLMRMMIGGYLKAKEGRKNG